MLLEASSQRMAEPCDVHGASESHQQTWVGSASNRVLGEAEGGSGGWDLNMLQQMRRYTMSQAPG